MTTTHNPRRNADLFRAIATRAVALHGPAIATESNPIRFDDKATLWLEPDGTLVHTGSLHSPEVNRCILHALALLWNMFHAEHGDTRGVFLSMQEFLPYRADGWSGTDETNEMADALLYANEGV